MVQEHISHSEITAILVYFTVLPPPNVANWLCVRVIDDEILEIRFNFHYKQHEPLFHKNEPIFLRLSKQQQRKFASVTVLPLPAPSKHV